MRSPTASQVMQAKFGHPVKSLVEVSLGSGPTRPPSTEHKLTIARLAFQDRPDLICNWQLVLPMVLPSLSRKHNQVALKVDFRPAQTANLVPALRRQNEYPDYLAKVVLAQCRQHLCKLGLGEHSVSARAFASLARSADRVDLDQALTDCPCKERRQAGTGSITSYWTACGFNVSQR